MRIICPLILWGLFSEAEGMLLEAWERSLRPGAAGVGCGVGGLRRQEAVQATVPQELRTRPHPAVTHQKRSPSRKKPACGEPRASGLGVPRP